MRVAPHSLMVAMVAMGMHALAQGMRGYNHATLFQESAALPRAYSRAALRLRYYNQRQKRKRARRMGRRH